MQRLSEKSLRFLVNRPIWGERDITRHHQPSRNTLNRHRLGTLLGLSFALYLPLVACGEDNDILREDTTPPPSTTDTTDPNLTDPNQLNSGGGTCDVSACGTPPPGGATACCTTAEDVTANRAVEASKCGLDMAAFGFPGCTQKDQPGTLDPACPDVEFPPGAPPMAGCCTASGHCGAMETFMGFGCNANPDSSTWVSCGG
jgi:hypothetical protein